MNTTLRSVFLSVSLISILTACGQTVGHSSVTVVNPEQSGIENPDPTLPAPAIGEQIGRFSYAVTANKSVAVRGEENGNHFAQLRTYAGISSPGAYYGVGYGSKAMLGFGEGFHGTKVSEFQGITFRTFEPTTNRPSNYNVYLNLIVDLNCNPLKPDYVVVLTRNLGGNAKGAWNTYEIKSTDAAFRTPGGKGGLPDSRSRANPAALTLLIAAKPDACFVSADIFDLGMKRGQKLAPIQLVHGDSIYNQSSAVRIDDIQVRFANATLVEDFE